jgi:hypothetical protein
MKYLKAFENYYKKYEFAVNDFVKLIHEYPGRKFKVIERKCKGNHGSKHTINMYYLETVDDDFDMNLWPIHLWEYQSKIEKLTSEELEELQILSTSNKYNF